MVTGDVVVELLCAAASNKKKRSWFSGRVPNGCHRNDGALLATYITLALASTKTRKRYEAMVKIMISKGRVTPKVLERCFAALRIDESPTKCWNTVFAAPLAATP